MRYLREGHTIGLKNQSRVVEGDTEVAVFSMIDELVTKLGVENSSI